MQGAHFRTFACETPRPARQGDCVLDEWSQLLGFRQSSNNSFVASVD
jgi:hypothetical protein